MTDIGQSKDCIITDRIYTSPFSSCSDNITPISKHKSGFEKRWKSLNISEFLFQTEDIVKRGRYVCNVSLQCIDSQFTQGFQTDIKGKMEHKSF